MTRTDPAPAARSFTSFGVACAPGLRPSFWPDARRPRPRPRPLRARRPRPPPTARGHARAGRLGQPGREQRDGRLSQALGKAEEKLGDAGVTAKVKAALLAAADVKAMQIDVDTHDGAVTLNARRRRARPVERAASVARGTDGVKSVDNRLAVKAP